MMAISEYYIQRIDRVHLPFASNQSQQYGSRTFNPLAVHGSIAQ